MNQRTATVQTIISVLKENGVKYELGGSTPVSEVFTDEMKEQVRKLLVAGFETGKIEMAEESKVKYADVKELKKYVTGLINNWVRKAPEFNAGGKYQAKNPGARAGSSDEQLAEMNKLLKQTNDPAARAAIQKEIDARKTEILYSKQPQIDASKLPAHLRQYVK